MRIVGGGVSERSLSFKNLIGRAGRLSDEENLITVMSLLKALSFTRSELMKIFFKRCFGN